jgi:hypothetical protein
MSHHLRKYPPEVEVVHTDYCYRIARLLSDFDRTAARARPRLLARYGDQAASMVIAEWRTRYSTFIPQIPFIGHNSPFLIFLIPGVRHFALYRALQSRGETVDWVGQLIYKISEAEFLAIPVLARRIAAALWFSRWFQKRLQKRATESQNRPYPKGYVMAFVRGDTKSFDFGIDYTECALCNFLKENGAMELAPYICAVDKVASETMGWGLSRTMTLADGRTKCDFRFCRGGPTDVPVPSSLTEGV